MCVALLKKGIFQVSIMYFIFQLGLSGDECRNRAKRRARRGNFTGPRNAQNGGYSGQVAVTTSKSFTMSRARYSATQEFLLLLTVPVHVVIQTTFCLPKSKKRVYYETDTFNLWSKCQYRRKLFQLACLLQNQNIRR